MSLRKQWKPLDESTVRSAPDTIGVYEFGDGDGESLGMAVGVIRDDLKEELAYGEAKKVRWRTATSRRHAESMLEGN